MLRAWLLVPAGWLLVLVYLKHVARHGRRVAVPWSMLVGLVLAYPILLVPW